MNRGDYHDRLLHQLVVGLALLLAAFILYHGGRRGLRAMRAARLSRPAPVRPPVYEPVQERASYPPASMPPVEIDRRAQPTKRTSTSRPPIDPPRPL